MRPSQLIAFICIAILFCTVTIALLLPEERTDFRYPEYDKIALSSEQEWNSFSVSGEIIDLEEISKRKQAERENTRYNHMRLVEIERDRGTEVEIRDMTLYNHFIKNNNAAYTS